MFDDSFYYEITEIVHKVLILECVYICVRTWEKLAKTH